MKKYFTYVPFWLSIIINIILSGLASGPILFAIVCICGLFHKPPLKDQLIGWLILIGIFLIIILVNYIVYHICKKKSKRDLPTTNNKKIVIKSIIIIVILVILGFSFFILPDLWLLINDWWF